ncbi:MAG: hypothetical protein ACI8TX_000723 [Hyphomicrobiaceae bacterium]|jgi:hypothetical protein
MIDVAGIADASGNAVAPSTTEFTTASGSDFTQPFRVTVSPSSVGVPINTMVTVGFSEAVDPATVNSQTVRFLLRSNNMDVASQRTVSADGTRVLIAPDALLDTETQYRVSTTSLVQDDTSPTVTFITPEDSGTLVPLNTKITIRMSEPIVREIVGPQTVSVERVGGDEISGTWAFEENASLLVFSVVDLLEPEADYNVTVSGLTDSAGNEMVGLASATFTSGTGADFVRPVATASDPLDNATGTSRTGPFTVTFNEALNLAALSPSNFELRDQLLAVVLPISMSLDATRKIVSITPDATLGPDRAHRLRVFSSSGVRDVAGNISSSSLFLDFITGP